MVHVVTFYQVFMGKSFAQSCKELIVICFHSLNDAKFGKNDICLAGEWGRHHPTQKSEVSWAATQEAMTMSLGWHYLAGTFGSLNFTQQIDGHTKGFSKNVYFWGSVIGCWGPVCQFPMLVGWLFRTLSVEHGRRLLGAGPNSTNLGGHCTGPLGLGGPGATIGGPGRPCLAGCGGSVHRARTSPQPAGIGGRWSSRLKLGIPLCSLGLFAPISQVGG